MSWRPGRLDRYLARTVLLSTLATWAVLVGFDVVTALVGEFDEIGQGGYSIGHAVLYVVHTLPRRAYEIFPTVALIGTLLGLGGLAASSELTVMRALGLSPWRIGAGAVLSLMLLTALMVVNAETLGPAAEQRAQAIANEAKGRDLIVARHSGLWAREGRVFLNARGGAQRRDESGEWIELQGVRLFEFDADGRLLSLAEASSATHRDGSWLLREVVRQRFEARAVVTETLPEERWQSQLEPKVVAAAVARPRYLSA
ncbi:MAG TPA: LptF/LptG family permease, partial [Arenimonas sp.]|nr:LptF/LptG family permease [Arenimonas sp.]